MTKLLPIFIAGLLLTGCLESITKVNTTIGNVSASERFDKVCKGRPLAYQLYGMAKRDFLTIPMSVDERVQKANASLESLCRNRPSNIVEALVEAQRQLDIITAAASDANQVATEAVITQ